MLNRRHLRVKVLQALYAHFQSEGGEVARQEKSLVSSIEGIYDLYIYLLSSLIEIRDFAHNRMEDARQKFLPTEEELNPNTRFVDNRFLAQMSDNRSLQKNIQRLKINWADHQEIFRKIFVAFKDSPAYLRYMDKVDATYADDKEIVVQLFGEFMLGSETFLSLFEEKSIHWADDIDTATSLVVKTIKKWDAKMDDFQPLPPLMISPDEEGDDLIRDFVLKLFRKTILNAANYDKLIAERAQNWDIERIALLDVIILKMALTELMDFPSIPVKVTLNEYIEISKDYSTPKSRQFVNGMLDKLVTDLRSSNEIKKTGRGLIE
ncbi:MAG: transcription antitermination factor NusB [Lentimicrobium sp.]|nr:transcription antitermination factor NusB [Lentimicrobium sp.]